MTLTCTVFGHRYGEVDVERTREEEGSEVVSTIRELETCVRCGHQRVVSENKEVTTRDVAADEGEGATATATRSAGPSGEPSEADPVDETAVAEAEPDAVAPVAATDDAGGDDGVILEEGSDRDPGTWPSEPEPEDPDWQPGTEPTTPEPDVTAAESAVAVPEGSYYCDACGFSTPVDASSLREGDFCPECHTGSLVHSPEDQ